MIEHKIQEISKNNNGKKYNVSLKIPMKYGFLEDVVFNVYINNYTRSFKLNYSHCDNEYAYFDSDVFLHNSCLYHYNFSYKINNQLHYYNAPESKVSVNYSTPDWFKDKKMYHIFVDRYKKGRKEKLKPMSGRIIHEDLTEELIIDSKDIKNNDFYGGDLQGIIEDLDCIKSSGISILYLSPIVLSQSNHRYDTADYEQIDPYVGTHEDLRVLCNEAHKRGMYVILDAVFNHTGNDSKYFNEFGNYSTLGAFQSKKSFYYPIYQKEINKDGREDFKYWWGLKNLPVCDGSNKWWQNYIYGEGGIIDKWMDLGIDGLRLDVADELSDEFIKGIHDRVKYHKSDAVIIGEVWENPMRMNRAYMNYMHSVMNYYLIDALMRYYKYNDKDKLGNVMRQINSEYPNETISSLMNFTSTHDISRIMNIMSTDEFDINKKWAWDVKNESRDYQKDYKIPDDQYIKGREVYKSYLLSLALMPGNLSIFYGDEAGMQGLGNLYNRKYFIRDNIDTNIFNYTKWLLNTINKEDEDIIGSIATPLDINDKYLMYERKAKEYTYLISNNKSEDYARLYLPDGYSEEDILFTTNNSNYKELSPFGGLVLKKKNI